VLERSDNYHQLLMDLSVVRFVRELIKRHGERLWLLEQRLFERLGNHRHVGDIRGRGLFRGIELVADRASKEPFDPALKLNARIKAAAMERGLACYPGGGTADGLRGDHVLLAPPYIVSVEEIDLLVDRLGTAIDAAINDITRR